MGMQDEIYYLALKCFYSFEGKTEDHDGNVITCKRCIAFEKR